MNEIKKIGVLTSGGDCSGLNAVIRGVVNCATEKGWEVYGIKNGTDGLTEKPVRYEKLTVENFSNAPWMRISGSYLGSLNKGVKHVSMTELTKRFQEGVKELELDAIVVVGGDGSMDIVSNYCIGAGVKMMGIPKTIDNDTPITEHSVGFATAREVCTTAIDSLDATARSHQRALILEVMGRDAGHLAIESALAGGADVCLVPEIPYKIDNVIKKLKQVKATGRDHSIIVVSEGLAKEDGSHVSNAKNKVGESIYGGIAQYLSAELNSRYPEFQTRVTTLGHIQRSGTPTSYDRLTAAVFAARAIELLAEGKSNMMVAWKCGEVKEYPIAEVVKKGTTLLNTKSDVVTAAKALGMYVGELD